MQNRKDDDAIELYSNYTHKLNNDDKNNQIPVNVGIIDNNDRNGDSSENSSICFPPVYHTNINDSALPDRPKSAVQIVKHQLQLNSGIKRSSLKTRGNKMAPMNLYGVKLSHSAKERQRDFAHQKRNLRSADDCLFTVSSKVPVDRSDLVRCIGDNHLGDHIHLNNHDKANKLPPLNVKSKDVPWVHRTLNGDNVISVVDVD